jgi:hypothetical protein
MDKESNYVMDYILCQYCKVLRCVYICMLLTSWNGFSRLLIYVPFYNFVTRLAYSIYTKQITMDNTCKKMTEHLCQWSQGLNCHLAIVHSAVHVVRFAIWSHYIQTRQMSRIWQLYIFSSFEATTIKLRAHDWSNATIGWDSATH